MKVFTIILLLMIVCIEKEWCGQKGDVYYPCELKKEKIVENQNFQWSTLSKYNGGKFEN